MPRRRKTYGIAKKEEDTRHWQEVGRHTALPRSKKTHGIAKKEEDTRHWQEVGGHTALTRRKTHGIDKKKEDFEGFGNLKILNTCLATMNEIA